MGNDILENVIYLCYYKTKSLQNVHVLCHGRNTRTRLLRSNFGFIVAKIYNILRYVIPRILRHMCMSYEISQKRSKGIKNWKITYSVILSVLSNKTNLILGFSSPLKGSILSIVKSRDQGKLGRMPPSTLCC